MISVVIPTWNAEATLPATLSALIPAAVDGIVREVVITDGGSDDATRRIADGAGARIIDGTKGRGLQLQAGAAAARFDWLLFLHADTVLEPQWHQEVAAWIEKGHSEGLSRAAVFRFALDDSGLPPRLIEWGVELRCAVFAKPYGDQGLLISRTLYDEIGGYKALPLFEDVDIIRRIGRRRLKWLRTKASTSAERYRRDGYARRVARNWQCAALYMCGASPERLEKIYHD